MDNTKPTSFMWWVVHRDGIVYPVRCSYVTYDKDENMILGEPVSFIVSEFDKGDSALVEYKGEPAVCLVLGNFNTKYYDKFIENIQSDNFDINNPGLNYIIRYFSYEDKDYAVIVYGFGQRVPTIITCSAGLGLAIVLFTVYIILADKSKWNLWNTIRKMNTKKESADTIVDSTNF